MKTGMLYAAGFFYYLLSVALNYAVIAQKASSDAQARALESSMRAREAELTALKAQINPHFLYNSLNSISALTSIDPARAREMCVLLADFLRMTLGMGEKALIPLQGGTGTAGEILRDRKGAIRRAVDGERGDCRRDEGVRGASAAAATAGGECGGAWNRTIAGRWMDPADATRNAGRIGVTVENSWDPEAVSSRKNGVGLKNVQRRLEARYGHEAYLEAKAEDEVFRVRLSFPAEAEGKA